MATRNPLPSSAGFAPDHVSTGPHPSRDARASRAMPAPDGELALAREQSAALARALAAQNDELRALQKTVRDQGRELDERRAEGQARSLAVGSRGMSEGAFVAHVSHELRTPLHAILSLSQLLLDELVGPLSIEQRKYLEVVDRNAQNLLRLASDLLDLSSIQSGALAVAAGATDVGASIRAVVLALAPLAKAKGLGLTVDVPASLPPAWCDMSRLEQVLTNLVSNAIKFTTVGSVVITADADAITGTINVHVTDTGVGIAEGPCARIFDEFFQAEPTHRKHGCGLGLAIVRRLTLLMRGQITVTSTPGVGSRFTLTLPLKEEGARGTHTAG